MKTTIKSSIRIATLLALWLTATCCILSEPIETHSDTAWLATLLLSKTVGIVAVLAAVRLQRHWRHDPAIRALDRRTDIEQA